MRKLIVLFLVILMVIGTLSGCKKGHQDGADIMKEVSEKLQNVSYMKASVEASMKITYEYSPMDLEGAFVEDEGFEILDEEGLEEGEPEEAEAEEEEEPSEALDIAENSEDEEEMITEVSEMKMKMDIETSSDPEATHMTMDMSMIMDEVEDQSTAEIYVLSEDEETYQIYSSYDEEWYKELVDRAEYGDVQESLGMITGLLQEELKFDVADKTETVEEKECYVLTTKLSGPALEQVAVTSLSAIMGETIDLSDKELPITLYIAKEEKLPVQISMDLSDIINQFMEGFGTTVSDFKETVTFLQIGGEGTITVPDDVQEAAVEYDMFDDSEESFELDDLEGMSEDDAETIEMEQPQFENHESEDTTMNYGEATADYPASLNQWFRTYATYEDGACFEVGVRITSVERGEGIQDQVDNLKKIYEEDPTASLDEALEYVMITYEVYVPTDYPVENFNGIEIYLKSIDNQYFETDYGFEDMYWVQTTDDSQLYVGPGETAKVKAVYSMEKDLKDYILEVGDSWGAESYVAIHE